MMTTYPPDDGRIIRYGWPELEGLPLAPARNAAGLVHLPYLGVDAAAVLALGLFVQHSGTASIKHDTTRSAVRDNLLRHDLLREALRGRTVMDGGVSIDRVTVTPRWAWDLASTQHANQLLPGGYTDGFWRTAWRLMLTDAELRAAWAVCAPQMGNVEPCRKWLFEQVDRYLTSGAGSWEGTP